MGARLVGARPTWQRFDSASMTGEIGQAPASCMKPAQRTQPGLPPEWQTQWSLPKGHLDGIVTTAALSMHIWRADCQPPSSGVHPQATVSRAACDSSWQCRQAQLTPCARWPAAARDWLHRRILVAAAHGSTCSVSCPRSPAPPCTMHDCPADSMQI